MEYECVDMCMDMCAGMRVEMWQVPCTPWLRMSKKLPQNGLQCGSPEHEHSLWIATPSQKHARADMCTGVWTWA